MKRGGFWMTTVTTGVAVLGLMTVGRAGFRSQAVLFLQGQMKIAAGDTESGLRLLAEVSSRPQMGSSATNPVENASETIKSPCRSWAKSKPNSGSEPKVIRTEQVSHNVKPAPVPTLASLVTPAIPVPPMVQAPHAQDAMTYIPAAQGEQLRAQRVAFEKAQRIRELELKRTMRQISYKYEVDVPRAQDIQVQVERGLQRLAQ